MLVMVYRRDRLEMRFGLGFRMAMGKGWDLRVSVRVQDWVGLRVWENLISCVAWVLKTW